MTTVNGKPIPERYGSIENLPLLIDELDRDFSAWPDGNYSVDELDWLHQFHSLCGDKHFINVADIESASIHGPKRFRELDTKQKQDLVAYFSRVFSNFTSVPTTIKTKSVSSHGVQIHRVSPLSLQVTADPIQSKDSIVELADEFAEDILPKSKKGIYRDAMSPLIGQLDQEQQLELLQDLVELDPSLPMNQLIDKILQIMSEYGVEDQMLRILLNSDTVMVSGDLADPV